MSHIVEIKTQVTDAEAVTAACRRLGLPLPAPETDVQLFSECVRGLAVKLTGWKYPAVCQLSTGEIKYDNYNGHWGDPQKLDGFLQAYAVEKAKLEARKKGYSVTEQPLANGSIKLTVQVAGGAA